MLMQTLPDVTSNVTSDTPLTLRWVGMEDIAVPISIKAQHQQLQTLIAKANAYVSLASTKTKGIHMSRVHLTLNDLAELECTQANINSLLERMINSQAGISDEAKLELSFNVLLEKPALLSGESGFQSYPIVIRAQKSNQGFAHELEITIPYSSTCPCSASLARQLYSNAINQTFPGATIDKSELLNWVQSQAGSVATPHSQRSYAYLRLSLGDNPWPDIGSFIFELEKVIGTPVQTAVKRSDEQEFARLNAANLMFCEDAARRIKNSLKQMDVVEDYWFKVEHQESLHAHNAVVIEHS